MMVCKRRGFIKKTVAGTVALGFSGQRNLFAAGMHRGDMELRFGIIGLGNRARMHLQAIQSIPGMEVAGICDIRPERFILAQRELGKKAKQFSDYCELLADEDINVVLVNTPNLYHVPMAIDAIKRKKLVLCEKPMGVTWKECLDIQRAESEARTAVPILYTFQLRYSEKYNKLKKVISSGRIGKPQYAFLLRQRGDWAPQGWLHTRPSGEKINWRYDYGATGGTLNEKMCHYFDMLNWMFDSTPNSVLCSGGINHYLDDNRDTWDHANVILEYPGDLSVLTSLCMYGPRRLELQIMGSEGGLFMGTDDHILFQETARGRRGKYQKIPLIDEPGHREASLDTPVIPMYKEFLDSVRNKTSHTVTKEMAMNASKIAWLGEKSNELGRVVQWDEL